MHEAQNLGLPAEGGYVTHVPEKLFHPRMTDLNLVCAPSVRTAGEWPENRYFELLEVCIACAVWTIYLGVDIYQRTR